MTSTFQARSLRLQIAPLAIGNLPPLPVAAGGPKSRGPWSRPGRPLPSSICMSEIVSTHDVGDKRHHISAVSLGLLGLAISRARCASTTSDSHHVFPFLLVSFPRPAKCDVQGENMDANRDPRNREIGCRIAFCYGVLPGMEDMGLPVWSFVTLALPP